MCNKKGIKVVQNIDDNYNYLCFSGTLIFCLRHGWVGNVGEFALLSPSEGNPITVPANFVGL